MSAAAPATVVYLRNALSPQGRQVLHAAPGVAIRALAPNWPTPHLALLDGEAIMRAAWGRALQPGQTLAFVDVAALPQGGGGGGSDPMRTLLTLAVLVAAPQLAGMLVGTTSGLAFTAATVGVNLVGQALVNAVLPAPRLPSSQQATALAAPSPTYTLQAQGNAARLEAAIPEHFGRHIAYPDFAAQPYSEYAGNEQYLYQLLCIGRGQYEVEALRVEDTDIAAFDDITWELVPPGGTLTLFPAAVITSAEVAGQTLSCTAATYSQSGTTVTVTLAGHGLGIGKSVYLDVSSGTLAAGTYTITSAPDADTFVCTAGASATTSGACTVAPWLGGFVACAAGTQANALAVDYVLPLGLYQVSGSGALASISLSAEAQARLVDDDGAPAGSWVSLGVTTYSGATTTPQRYSERTALPDGRYEVRARRVDAEQTASGTGHQLAWGGLRAYLPDTRDFGDVTLLAMRLRASNNLTLQASRKINVIATRCLPVWDGSAWSAPVPTRSIAWAFAYAARQVGQPDSQIDLAGLLALDAVWAERGDTFDARFDAFLGFWEAASKIAAAGRAKPYMQGGLLRLHRDQAQTVPVALFSMRNIVRGSFKLQYLTPTEDTADAVRVAYFNSGRWATSRVTAALPDSAAEQPSKVELFGVVQREQAWREGMYLAACNRYRRRLVRFTTEMEGFIPSFGDLIAIQHDMPAWGQQAEAVAWTPGTRTLRVSEPLTWGTGTHYLGLRTATGGVDGPHVVTAGADAYTVVLAADPGITPATGGQAERTHVVFGWANTWRQPAILLKATPRGALVDIEAVAEDDAVHTADSGSPVPSVPSSQLGNFSPAPVVQGLSAVASVDAPERMLITWQPSAWAQYYLVEQSSGDGVWTRTAEPSTNNITAIALYGTATVVRVAAVGLARGPWAQVNYADAADLMWTGSDADLMWTGADSDLLWS